MTICAVYGCLNRSDRKKNGSDYISFYRFPKVVENKGPDVKTLSEERLNLWISKLQRRDLNASIVKTKRICSKHFIGGKPSKLEEKTHPDWAPNTVLGYGAAKVPSSERYMRIQQREVAKPTLPISEDIYCEIAEDIVCKNPTTKSVSCQTDLTMDIIRQMEMELKNRNEEIYVLREKVKNISYDESTFDDDEEKVPFYTGIPNFALLMVVFNELSPYVQNTKKNALSSFQEFVLFLMRLRLNLFFQDLGYRFGISTSTASRIFRKWLEVSFIRLKKLIRWPERGDLQATMPTSFLTTFGRNVAVIMDCFEIFMDRPSSLITRAATWSNYKSHNTVKILIGITPRGVISFVSNGWGGRTSDQHITEKCGVLDNLRVGDLVLADRGFRIEESVGLYCAQLILPAFTRGKNRLTPYQIHDTRKLASLRIHVERVIGNIRRKYTILKGHIPVETLASLEESAAIDKIVHVCCSLCNLSPSVVPL